MHHLVTAVVVRQVDCEHVDLGECGAQRVDARVVRAVAAADDERVLVEPEHVAALRGRRRSEPREYADPCRAEVALDRVDLHLPQLLAWAEQHGAASRHRGGVVDVDRVERGVERLADHDLDARSLERRHERLVLLDDAHGIGRGPPPVLLPALDPAGPPHEDAAEWRGHRHASDSRRPSRKRRSTGFVASSSARRYAAAASSARSRRRRRSARVEW